MCLKYDLAANYKNYRNYGMKKSSIPPKIYKTIVNLMPVLTTDIILNCCPRGYLLTKRKNHPLKGKWWLIGGRVLKGETLADAAKRKVFEETGIKLNNLYFVGYYEDFFNNSAHGVPSHTVSLVFYSNIKDNNLKIKLDYQSNNWKFSDTLPKRFLVHYARTPYKTLDVKNKKTHQIYK